MLDIRWLAMDLDRTIIGPEHVIRPETVQILQRAADTGYRLVIATGRPPRSIRPIIRAIDREIAFVAYNGGYAEAPDGERLCDDRMDALTATRVLNTMRSANPGGILMEVNDSFHLDEETEITKQHVNRIQFQPTSVNRLDYFLRSGVNKFLAIGTRETISRTEALLREIVPDQVIIRPTLYNDTLVDYVEVMPRGVSKQTGIDAILGRFGWSWRHGVAFGDADNDIEMLQAAKHAVVVEDGSERARAAASEICPSARNLGVVKWLEHFLIETEKQREEARKNAN